MKKLMDILKKIEIRNNFVTPPKKFLDELGITLREFIFLKWKIHRELEQKPEERLERIMRAREEKQYRMQWKYNKKVYNEKKND